MDSKEIQELLKLINRLELAEFKYKEGDLQFSVRTKYYLTSRSGTDGTPSYVHLPDVYKRQLLQRPSLLYFSHFFDSRFDARS